MIEHQRAIQVYTGEKWRERDKRMPIPATVIDVDEKYVYLQRGRKTRVSIDQFLKRFDKVEHAPQRQSDNSTTSYGMLDYLRGEGIERIYKNDKGFWLYPKDDNDKIIYDSHKSTGPYSTLEEAIHVGSAASEFPTLGQAWVSSVTQANAPDMYDTPSRVSPSARNPQCICRLQFGYDSQCPIHCPRYEASSPAPSTPEEEGSPNWAAGIRKELADRGYERINDSPRAPSRESRSEIKRRVIMDGGTMDEAFEEIKRVESPSRGTEEELEKLLNRLELTSGEMEVCECFANDCPHEQQAKDARLAVESYVSRLRDERDRLQRLETYVCQAIAMGNQADLTVESLPK